MFELLDEHQVSELHVRYDVSSGLKAFVAIHSTHLGPALGGCRFIKYANEKEALVDALSLARGMSYKAALADVPQGGGKSVIMLPEGGFDRQALFGEFGRFIESLNGRYITAIDSGTTAHEMDIIQKHSKYVTSTSDAGNPSPYTAKGVFEGIKASVRYKLGVNSLEGVRVAIQGIGNVGYCLGSLLAESGAEVIVADVCEQRVKSALKSFAVKAVSPEDIIKEPCAVFSPCGLSNVVNASSIQNLKCRIIAGSANVQLKSPDFGQLLHEKGILYAPDYVINSGGLIYASLMHNYDLGKLQCVDSIALRIELKVLKIGETLADIFERSTRTGIATSEIADMLAKEKLSCPRNEAA